MMTMMINRNNILYLTCVFAILITVQTGCSTKQLKPLKLDTVVPETWSASDCLTDETCNKLAITKGLLDLFDDPVLKGLVNEALAKNQNLLATALRLKSSGYLLRAVDVNALPELTAEASAGRNNQGVDSYTGARAMSNNYRMSLGFSWEIDIWGRLADERMAERWQHEALVEDYDRARDALAGRVIQAFIQAVAAKKAVDVNLQRLKILNANKALVIQKYRKGLGTMEGISTANTNIYIAEAELSRRREALESSIRHLEVLVGRFPEQKLSVANDFPEIRYPVVSIPRTVLMNRPDVQAALMNVEAGKRLSKVASKRRLPTIILTADLFKAAGSTGSLWNSPKNWGLIGNITQPVFNWGKLKNQSNAQDIEVDARKAELYDIVLNAIKEVEGVLSSDKYLELQSKAFACAVDEAVKSKKYYKKRYMAGLDSMTSLLMAQEQEMTVRQSLIEVRAARMSNRIDLAIATGSTVYNGLKDEVEKE